MGWSSGCELAEGIWKDIKGLIPQNQIHKTAVKIYDRFCDHDADDWEFKKGNLYYTALQLKDPEDFKEQLEETKGENICFSCENFKEKTCALNFGVITLGDSTKYCKSFKDKTNGKC